MAALIRSLHKRYARSPLVLLSARQSPAELALCDEAAKHDVRVLVAPGLCPGDHGCDVVHPDAAPPTSPDATAEIICRYAHILIISRPPGEPDASSFVSLLETKWTTGAFTWASQEEAHDADLLTLPPVHGPLIDLEQPPAPGAKQRRRSRRPWSTRANFKPDYGWEKGQDDQLAAINRINRDGDRISEDLAEAKAKTLLSDDRLAEIVALARQDGGDSGVNDPAALHAFRLRTIFGRHDAFAIRTKRWLTWATIVFALAGPVGVLAYQFLATLGLMKPDHAIQIYVGIILTMLLAGLVLGLLRLQARFQEARNVAELIRVQMNWVLMGIDTRVEATIRRWIPSEVLSVQLVARTLDLWVACTPAPRFDATDFVLRTWVGTRSSADHAHAQTSWYRDNYLRMRQNSRRLQLLQFGSYGLAVALGVGMVAAGTLMPRTGLVEGLATAFLPALAGAFSILHERGSYQMYAQSYQRMERVSQQTSALLQTNQGKDTGLPRRLLRQFGREAIGESIDWLLINRDQEVAPVMGS
jgi:hypothetical protein